ncbi:MAG: flavin reductase family protein [Thermoplasmata archaeon]
MTGAEGPTGVGADSFRRLMAVWATGVSVVTARAGTEDAGLTVNAFLSVALDPPTILVSLTHDADTVPRLEASGTFAVNLLASDQRALSDRFARAVAPAEKFRGLPVLRGVTGAALLPDTLGALEARVLRRIEVADHLLYLGEVLRLHPGRDARPLLFFRSGYAEEEGTAALRLPVAPLPAKR